MIWTDKPSKYLRFAECGHGKFFWDDDGVPRLTWLYDAPKWATAINYWIESVGVELRDCEEILSEAEHQGHDLDELLKEENRVWAWPVLENAAREIFRHENETSYYF